MTDNDRVRLVEFTRAFHFGGTEVQLVELLRGLPDTYDFSVGVLEAKGPLLSDVLALGHRPEEFPLHASAARPNTFLQILRLAQWLRTQRAQLIHVHDFYATLIAVPAAKLAGCRVVVGRLDLAHWHGKARRAVLAGLTKLADHVIANAEAVRELLLQEEGISHDRISVVHNGLDAKRFDERRAAGLTAPLPDTQGAPVVVHVANMNHPVKRQEDLLDALVIARKSCPELQAFLVGNGPRRPWLEERARTLGLADAVHFLGHRKDVPAIYGRATLGVLCSSAEGLSNAVMEGMAAGLPMVVTRVGGNPELVQEGTHGYVVPPFRPQELAAAIIRLLQNPEKARAMGQAGSAFIRETLSLERMVKAHDAVYRQVLGLAPSPIQDRSDVLRRDQEHQVSKRLSPLPVRHNARQFSRSAERQACEKR